VMIILERETVKIMIHLCLLMMQPTRVIRIDLALLKGILLLRLTLSL
jgi:hypothetical protein